MLICSEHRIIDNLFYVALLIINEAYLQKSMYNIGPTEKRLSNTVVRVLFYVILATV